MYLLAQDTLNGAEGKITVTRDGRITEICGMKNIKTVAGIQTSDMKTIGTRTVQKRPMVSHADRHRQCLLWFQRQQPVHRYAAAVYQHWCNGNL